MENQKKSIWRQICRLNKQKKSVNVFDHLINDLMYEKHKKELCFASKKVDNLNPSVSSSKLFSRMKFKNMRSQIENRLKKNLRLVNFINATARSEGKVSCYNSVAASRSSKLPYKVNDQKQTDNENKRISEMLKKIEPSLISSKKRLNDDWQLNFLPAIVKASQYSIAISSLLNLKIDPFLENAPTYDEYQSSKKIFFVFFLENLGQVGKINIMLSNKKDPEIIKKFIDSCFSTSLNSYQHCKVYKIVPGLFIETGDTTRNDGSGTQPENFLKIYPKSCEEEEHLHAGTLSMLLEDDGSISSKFRITLKKTSIFDGQQVVIGRIVKGLEDLVALEQFGTRFGRPKKHIFINKCGLLK